MEQFNEETINQLPFGNSMRRLQRSRKHAVIAVTCAASASLRDDCRRWQPWLDGQLDKVEPSISAIEKAAPTFRERVDIGTISFACAFGYLDLRFPDFGWRSRHPKCAAWFTSFEVRPSMQATRHPVCLSLRLVSLGA
jgi:hypothetical protein